MGHYGIEHAIRLLQSVQILLLLDTRCSKVPLSLEPVR